MKTHGHYINFVDKSLNKSKFVSYNSCKKSIRSTKKLWIKLINIKYTWMASCTHQWQRKTIKSTSKRDNIVGKEAPLILKSSNSNNKINTNKSWNNMYWESWKLIGLRFSLGLRSRYEFKMAHFCNCFWCLCTSFLMCLA